MVKRKRVDFAANGPAATKKAQADDNLSKKKKKTTLIQPPPTAPAASTTKTPKVDIPKPKPKPSNGPFSLQIITGSYDRVLHGIIATVQPSKDAVDFADSFLFNAHPSAVRSIAVSPPSESAPGRDQKILLASGSSDPKINIYSLSAHPPRRREKDEMSSAGLRPILENSMNRELGLYNPHDSTVTKLAFPSRKKLISSSEDSTIAIARTRDWELMTTLKAPIPKALGRPSGDTAPFGGTPAGINDFAVHPSNMMLFTVSRGEQCIRLWDLTKGKKDEALNFSKATLREVGEGRHSTGEGRKVVCHPSEASLEYAVAFDRDVVVFGKTQCRIMPDTRVKVHHVEYITIDEAKELSLLAVSTEDGRILFCSTRPEDLSKPAPKSSEKGQKAETARLAIAKKVAHLGGKDNDVTGRIKEFSIASRVEEEGLCFYVTGGSSDGKVRVWRVTAKELQESLESSADERDQGKAAGKLLGTYSTDNRITCMAAYVMIPRSEDDEMESEENTEDEGASSEEDEES